MKEKSGDSGTGAEPCSAAVTGSPTGKASADSAGAHRKKRPKPAKRGPGAPRRNVNALKSGRYLSDLKRLRGTAREREKRSVEREGRLILAEHDAAGSATARAFVRDLARQELAARWFERDLQRSRKDRQGNPNPTMLRYLDLVNDKLPKWRGLLDALRELAPSRPEVREALIMRLPGGIEVPLLATGGLASGVSAPAAEAVPAASLLAPCEEVGPEAKGSTPSPEPVAPQRGAEPAIPPPVDPLPRSRGTERVEDEVPRPEPSRDWRGFGDHAPPGFRGDGDWKN